MIALTVGLSAWCALSGATPRPSTSPSTTSGPGSVPASGPEGWFAHREPNAPRPKLPEKLTGDRVFIIPIREEITGKTFDALERKVIRCRASGAQLVVLDMDTWGGEVHAALDICRLIKTNLKGIYTVCYVRTRAVSAGAMIAMSCHEIVMGPVGTFGDCAPISLAGKLEGTEREKIETVLRTEFKESADRNGYDALLSTRMVSTGVEMWLVRHKQTGELRYVNAKEYRSQVSNPPDLTSGPANPKGEWEYVREILASDRLLTMHASEAMEYGFVRAKVEPGEEDPLGPLMRHYQVVGAPTVLDDNWSEILVEFLISAPVSGILLFAGIICAYIEMNHPGLIVPAVIAVICFGILFGSRYLVGMAQWWHIALFLIGLVLVIIEVFATPTFGILGVVGIIMAVVGLLALVVPTGPDKWPLPETELDWKVFTRAAVAMGLAVVAATIAAGFLAKYLPRMPLASRLVLAPAATFTGPPVAESSPFTRVKVGDVGVAETMCRPVGKVRFGDDLLDASSEGGIVERGAKVRVLANDGNRLIVEEVKKVT